MSRTLHLAPAGVRHRIPATLVCVLALILAASAPAQAARVSWSRPYEVPGLTAAVDGLACPTTSLCLAISSNELFWSTRPSSRSSWHHQALEALTSPFVEGGTIGLTGLACASASFCVAVDNIGNAFTSTNPTGGASAWRLETIDNDTVAALQSVGCAADEVCAALSYTGSAFTSAAAGAWSRASVFNTPNGADFYGAACASATAGSACAAVAAGNRIVYTADPAAPTPTWHSAKLARGYELDGITCASASLCVAVGGYDNANQLAVSRRPAAGAWSALTLHGVGSTGAGLRYGRLPRDLALPGDRQRRRLLHAAGGERVGVACDEHPRHGQPDRGQLPVVIDLLRGQLHEPDRRRPLLDPTSLSDPAARLAPRASRLAPRVRARARRA